MTSQSVGRILLLRPIISFVESIEGDTESLASYIVYTMRCGPAWVWGRSLFGMGINENFIEYAI